MKKVLKYFAVIAYDGNEFQKHIDDLMKDDPRWQPFGGISIALCEHGIRYGQAFVIYEN